MIQQKTVVVKGESYLLTHIPASRGFTILKQIGKIAGPSIGAWQSGGMGAAVEAVFSNLDNANVEQLVKDLVNSAAKGSMAINFDTEFAGEYDKLFLLVQEVVEFNFGSVFTLLGSEG